MGIPSPKARQRTVTLYLDKGDFRQSLAIAHEQTIYVFLLDRQARVLWKSEGKFTIEAGQALRSAIEDNI